MGVCMCDCIHRRNDKWQRLVIILNNILCLSGWWSEGVLSVVSTGLLKRAELSSTDTSWSGTHTSRCSRTSNSLILNSIILKWVPPTAHTKPVQRKMSNVFFFIFYKPVQCFLSPVRDGMCATTSMSAGQTLGCPRVLLPCWTSVSMYFRDGTLQCRDWALLGRAFREVLLWLYTAVLASAAQVNSNAIMWCHFAKEGVMH